MDVEKARDLQYRVVGGKEAAPCRGRDARAATRRRSAAPQWTPTPGSPATRKGPGPGCSAPAPSSPQHLHHSGERFGDWTFELNRLAGDGVAELQSAGVEALPFEGADGGTEDGGGEEGHALESLRHGEAGASGAGIPAGQGLQ